MNNRKLFTKKVFEDIKDLLESRLGSLVDVRIEFDRVTFSLKSNKNIRGRISAHTLSFYDALTCICYKEPHNNYDKILTLHDVNFEPKSLQDFRHFEKYLPSPHDGIFEIVYEERDFEDKLVQEIPLEVTLHDSLVYLIDGIKRFILNKE